MKKWIMRMVLRRMYFSLRIKKNDMENSNMTGHWTGLFSTENGNTEIEFTEEVTAKKLMMKPFVKAYLKRQQRQYVMELRNALG